MAQAVGHTPGVEPGARRHDIGRPVTPTGQNHHPNRRTNTGSRYLHGRRKIEASHLAARSSFWSSCGEPFDDPELEAVLVFDLEAIVLDQDGWPPQEVLAAEGDGEDFKKPLDSAHRPR